MALDQHAMIFAGMVETTTQRADTAAVELSVLRVL